MLNACVLNLFDVDAWGKIWTMFILCFGSSGAQTILHFELIWLVEGPFSGRFNQHGSLNVCDPLIAVMSGRQSHVCIWTLPQLLSIWTETNTFRSDEFATWGICWWIMDSVNVISVMYTSAITLPKGQKSSSTLGSQLFIVRKQKLLHTVCRLAGQRNWTFKLTFKSKSFEASLFRGIKIIEKSCYVQVRFISTSQTFEVCTNRCLHLQLLGHLT